MGTMQMEAEGGFWFIYSLRISSAPARGWMAPSFGFVIYR
jgi:hypothetical protein